MAGVSPDREAYLQEVTNFPSDQEDVPLNLQLWAWEQRAIILAAGDTESVNLQTFAVGTAVQAVGKWTDPHDADQLSLHLTVAGNVQLLVSATQVEADRSRSALLHTFEGGPAAVMFVNNGTRPVRCDITVGTVALPRETAGG